MPLTFGSVPPTQPFTPAQSQIPPGQPDGSGLTPRPLGDSLLPEGPDIMRQPVTPNFGGEAWKRYLKQHHGAKDRLLQARSFLETCFAPLPEEAGFTCAADRDPQGCARFTMNLLEGSSVYYDSD